MSKLEIDSHAFAAATRATEDFSPSINLRDWFAGQALAGMQTANGTEFSKHELSTGHPNKIARWSATMAYRYADAMLAARAKDDE